MRDRAPLHDLGLATCLDVRGDISLLDVIDPDQRVRSSFGRGSPKWILRPRASQRRTRLNERKGIV